MYELNSTELMNINGGSDPGSILDMFNPKKIYDSGKSLAYDIKGIVTGKDDAINDFARGFVTGVKSALGF